MLQHINVVCSNFQNISRNILKNIGLTIAHGVSNQLGALPRGGRLGARPADKYLNGRASSRTSILFANEYLMVGKKYFEYFQIIQTPNNQVNIFCKQIFGGDNQHFEYFDI